jgi:3-methylcrotonyl-CoA carboxylase alpha subunit
MRVHLVEGANVDPVEKNESGEARDEVTLHEAKDGVYAFAGGRQAFVQLVDPFAQVEAGAEEGDSAIRAPMNGRLVAIAVEDGETVEAGQRLAVVEAMKMEHALVAPYAGVVRDLSAAVGEQVEMGETIMWVDKVEKRGEPPKASDRPM